MNRIDKVVVFRPLGSEELGRILSLELNQLQQRIFNSGSTTPFVFNVTADARAFLLRQGTDMKYGARHLKRAIERSLVHPLSNLIASDQVHGGDLIRIDFDPEVEELVFVKEAEQMAGLCDGPDDGNTARITGGRRRQPHLSRSRVHAAPTPKASAFAESVLRINGRPPVYGPAEIITQVSRQPSRVSQVCVTRSRTGST